MHKTTIQNRCIFYGFGTGKSKESLDRALKELNSDALIIVTKAGIIESWKEQIALWTELTPEQVSEKDEVSVPQYVCWEGARVCVQKSAWIVSYDFLRNLLTKKYPAKSAKNFTKRVFIELFSSPSTSIIFDESRVISLKNVIGKTLVDLVRKASKQFPESKGGFCKRFCLSGMPAPESPLEVYAQIEVATHPNNPFGSEYYAFVKKYFYRETWPPFRHKFLTGAKEHFEKVLEGTRKELEFPCSLINRFWYPSEEQFEALKTIQKSWELPVLSLEQEDSSGSESVTVGSYAPEEFEIQSTMQKMHTLRAVLSGIGPARELPFFNSSLVNGGPKADALIALLREILAGEHPVEKVPSPPEASIVEAENYPNHKIVIWHYYIEEGERLRERLQEEFPQCRLFDLDSAEAFRDYQPNSSLTPAFAIASLHRSEGINAFVCAHHAIYYSFHYSMEKMNQADHRLTRRGQTKVVNFYRLIGAATIEEDAYKLLEEKKLNTRQLHDAMLRRVY